MKHVMTFHKKGHLIADLHLGLNTPIAKIVLHALRQRGESHLNRDFDVYWYTLL